MTSCVRICCSGVSQPPDEDTMHTHPLDLKHSLPTLAGIPLTKSLDTDSEAWREEEEEEVVWGAESGHPKAGNDRYDIPQKRSVWITELNSILKHRLYETLDAQTQTYKSQTSNKKKYTHFDIAPK